MKVTLLLTALLGLVLGACSNKLEGELVVDGKPFAFDGCRSGQVYGFAGVELTATDGRRLRIVQTPTEEPIVVVFGAVERAAGAQIPRCGLFSVTPQSSTINDVRNVEGQATLDCESTDHSVRGKVTFGNCH